MDSKKENGTQVKICGTKIGQTYLIFVSIFISVSLRAFGHLRLNTLHVQLAYGNFGSVRRFKVDKTIALAFVRFLVQNGLGGDDVAVAGKKGKGR